MSPIPDATTTPPAARIPVLIGLMAVTVYLLVSLVSDQCLESEEPDIILPIFTVFKFLFIFGQ